jgi:hypothetical protein
VIAVSLMTVLEIAAAVIVAAAAVYWAVRWARPRKADEVGERRSSVNENPSRAALRAAAAATAANAGVQNPQVLGRLRSGREGNRPSEDDIVQQKMGPRGMPGEPPRTLALDESVTQIPKPLDPGHTA